ncbi:MAG: potassium channel family protein [Solirubrobacterales bacterium]
MSRLERLLQGTSTEVRERAHQDRLGYAPVMATVFLNIIVQLALPDEGYTRVISAVIAGFTLMLAFYAAGVSERRLKIVGVIVVLSVLASIGGTASQSQAGNILTPAVGFLLSIGAPLAIARDLIRQPEVTTRSVIGAATIYLLIGVFFGQVYTLMASAGDNPFFAQGTDGTISERLYFSFVTITTVGYGDFTAATQLGRAFASAEALIGQLYLVTVISVLVGNLGRKNKAAGPGAQAGGEQPAASPQK